MSLRNNEKKLIAVRSNEWFGPNSWGFVNGYRLSLHQAIQHPEFG
jgi:hypothetical protein